MNINISIYIFAFIILLFVILVVFMNDKMNKVIAKNEELTESLEATRRDLLNVKMNSINCGKNETKKVVKSSNKGDFGDDFRF